MKNIILFLMFVLAAFSVKAQSLSTPFNTDNSASGIFFNIIAANEVTINDFESNFSTDPAEMPPPPYTVEVYFKAGSYLGSENTAGDWTLAGSASGITSNGVDVPTPIPVNLNVIIPAGQIFGFYVVVIGAGSDGNALLYTDGSGTAGVTVIASDPNISITEGTSSRRPPFSAPNFDPRNPNIVVNYSLGSPGNAGTIFAGVARNDGTAPGALIALNPSNASGSFLGDPVTPGGITGLAFNASETLYASTIDGPVGNRTSRLIIISQSGSLLTDIGPITVSGVPVSIGDISFQPGTNILFGIRSNADGFNLGSRLYTINTGTGIATLVGDTGTGVGGGLAFAPNGDLYFSSGPTMLYVINPANAAVVSSVPTSAYFDGLGIDPVSGTLWASIGGPGGDVYTINPATGSASLVGNAGFGISDIAFGPPPLVPTLGEWGMILLILLTFTFGAVFMTNRKMQLAGAGGTVSVGSTLRNFPFNGAVYDRFLLVTFGIVALGFAVAIFAFGYSLAVADIPGILICSPVLAYLGYLLFGRDSD